MNRLFASSSRYLDRPDRLGARTGPPVNREGLVISAERPWWTGPTNKGREPPAGVWAPETPMTARERTEIDGLNSTKRNAKMKPPTGVAQGLAAKPSPTVSDADVDGSLDLERVVTLKAPLEASYLHKAEESTESTYAEDKPITTPTATATPASTYTEQVVIRNTINRPIMYTLARTSPEFIIGIVTRENG
ncbi:hypothetical protein CHU98_g10134 [Xylaria longipes]|nr:hypothetical protein CHU98_g10134 [Xylaria longipes]